MHKGSGSFVGALGIEGYQIEQLSHPAPHAFPIAFFQFMGIEVGGAVGPNVVVDEQFISGEQDLTHHIAVLTIVSAGGFHPKVIKTKVLSIAIVLDEFVTHMVEPKNNVPAWNHRIGSLMGHQIFQQPHQTGLAAAHGTGQQQAFSRVNTRLPALVIIPDDIVAELEQYAPISFIDLKVFTEHQFPFDLEIAEHFIKVIDYLVALEFPNTIGTVSFFDDMWLVEFHKGSP
jgi:hypothetical protein